MAMLYTTSEMLDYMELRYGKGDATARANMLKWLQQAERDLWRQGDWWFREEEVEYTFAVAVGKYSLAQEVSDVIDMFNADGTLMEKIPERTWRANYRATALAALGTPNRWTLDPRSSSDQTLVMRIYPLPVTGKTAARMVRELRAATLLDSTDNQSAFPVNDRPAVCLHALKHMAQHEGKPEMAAQFDADEKEVLQAVRAANAAHKAGNT